MHKGVEIISRAALLAAAITAPSTRTVGQDLGKAEVLLLEKNWKLLRSKSSMTDKTVCVAIYRDNYRMQLNRESFYINYRGKGGVDAYRYRIDDAPPIELRLATETEKRISSLMLNKNEVQRIISAKRLRISVLTILQTSIEEDIDLNGIATIHSALSGDRCK